MRKHLYTLSIILLFCIVNIWGTPANRKEVNSISELSQFINTPEKGIFFIDADEVLFTWKVDRNTKKVSIIRLYDDLEGLLKQLRCKGHKLYIMTYNHAHVITEKLNAINLSVDMFDGVLACNMKGDLYTSKGKLFKDALKNQAYDFTVFIDNFPVFVEDVERVAAENKVKLYSFVCTGYKAYYHAFVHQHLANLQKKLQKNKKEASGLLHRIQASLKRYAIDIYTFSETYPDVSTLEEKTQDLIWPYLVYL